MKPKFKKGDTVMVIGWNGIKDIEDRFSWIQSMDKHIGKTFTVDDHINERASYSNIAYTLCNDDHCWGWMEAWLRKQPDLKLEDDLFEI
jgi:hypothetical protein